MWNITDVKVKDVRGSEEPKIKSSRGRRNGRRWRRMERSIMVPMFCEEQGGCERSEGERF